ncbi:ModD protein [Oryzibacter oryziterrae]|uniref:ModD protein n=1 Tax=Oryzibacter oryziterrae TaxID=2766474 RepID=UPI001F02DD3E|nr:ModD protein [Oryzibacter oryziterrae]
MITLADIERLLEEDAGGGDVTTEALGIGALPGRMEFRARGAMVLAGIEVAARMMAGLDVQILVRDGTLCAAGQPLLTARGTAGELHRVWKAAQTLLEILSGIATATRELVDASAAVNPDVRIATTRKTVPGVRRLSQLAVKAGGGILHRQGLGETVLVFDQHRVFLDGWDFRAIHAQLRAQQPEKALGIEVASVEDALEAAAAGFDVIQLEKFSPADVAALAGKIGVTKRPLLAAAGGLSPETVGAYIAAGAGLIVTSWPYTARPRDVAVTLHRG